MGGSPAFSPVERAFIRESGRQEAYGSEKIPTVEVANVTALGKLVCLRFLEWARDNPKGVVALPTGEGLTGWMAALSALPAAPTCFCMV